jgi:flavin reductase (DIM6/NTAB) family NADH-FMN oxidoreductase RutF
MSIEPAEFRRIMAHLATGVTVVTAVEPHGAARGLTASAVASVSLDPPLVLACVDRQADTHDCIERAGAFAVNVLGADQVAKARRFADAPAAEKFDGIAFRTDHTGAPVLEGALSWVDCRLWASYDGGDHTIFVGRVVSGGASGGAPLLHFCGGYVRLDSQA